MRGDNNTRKIISQILWPLLCKFIKTKADMTSLVTLSPSHVCLPCQSANLSFLPESFTCRLLTDILPNSVVFHIALISLFSIKSSLPNTCSFKASSTLFKYKWCEILQKMIILKVYLICLLIKTFILTYCSLFAYHQILVFVCVQLSIRART